MVALMESSHRKILHCLGHHPIHQQGWSIRLDGWAIPKSNPIQSIIHHLSSMIHDPWPIIIIIIIIFIIILILIIHHSHPSSIILIHHPSSIIIHDQSPAWLLGHSISSAAKALPGPLGPNRATLVANFRRQQRATVGKFYTMMPIVLLKRNHSSRFVSWRMYSNIF